MALGVHPARLSTWWASLRGCSDVLGLNKNGPELYKHVTAISALSTTLSLINNYICNSNLCFVHYPSLISIYDGSYNLQVIAETMDADRDEVQEELMANLIAGGGNAGGGDADVTATYLNDSGEGAEDLE